MDYKNFKTAQRKSALWQGCTAFMCFLRDEDLDLMGLSSETRSDIDKMRLTDDWPGIGMAFFLMSVSNSDITDWDRVVLGQIMNASSGTIIAKRVLQKSVLDGQDVLSSRTAFKQMYDWFSKSNTVVHLNGDAFDEEVVSVINYIEQYNRDIPDRSFAYINSGEQGDDETPQIESELLDKIPFMGQKE